MISTSFPHKFIQLGIVAALALAMAMPREASAHAKLESSTPKDKAKLKETPKQIELRFSELLDDKFNTVEVYPSSQVKEKTHSNLADGEPKVDAKDHTRLTVSLKSLPPGDYTVDWRVLSRDGHSAPGRFTFKVLAPK